MATTGRYRLLGDRAGGDERLLLDVEDHEVVALPAAPFEALPAGYLVDCAVDWADGPAVESVAVVERTLFAFVDGATNLFEAALDAWEEARREGLSVNSRVTYDTGRDPNGALYTFAAGPGGPDLLAEFRNGGRPLEPLVERAAEGRDPPFEVFVLRPAAHQFVLVYIVFEKGSVLADTVRDTYGCPRPEEPDAD